MGFDLFEVDNPELNAIWRDVEDSGGVITPEQERRVDEIMADELGLIGCAAKVAQLEYNAKQLRAWVHEAQGRYRRWEQLAGRMRAAMLKFLRDLLPESHLPKGKKSIMGQRGALRIGLRQNHDGRLDPNDPALDHEKTIKGYTAEQVEASQIDKRYFEKREVWVLNREKLADEVRVVESAPKGVRRPKRLGLARLDREPSVTITVLGGASGKQRSGSGEVAESQAS